MLRYAHVERKMCTRYISIWLSLGWMMRNTADYRHSVHAWSVADCQRPDRPKTQHTKSGQTSADSAGEVRQAVALGVGAEMIGGQAGGVSGIVRVKELGCNELGECMAVWLPVQVHD